MTEQTSTAPSAVLEALRGALARAVRALIATEEMHMPSGKRQMFTVAIEFGNDALEKQAALTAAAPADLANHPLVESAYEAAMVPADEQPEMTLEELKAAAPGEKGE